MKLCKDCKHLHNEIYCKSPSNGLSLVNGQPISRFAIINRKTKEYVSYIKETENKFVDPSCGPDADYFEPKLKCVNPKKWYQFWRLKDICSMGADGYCARCHAESYPFI